MTTGTTSTGSSSAASLLVNGLVSGINTQAVIQALLQSYSVPITNLQNQQTSLNSEASDYQVLNTDMQSVLSAANALNTNAQWNLATASSSNSTVATATASPGAQTGTLSFNVSQLAQSNMLVSQSGVSSTGSVVTAASSLLVATGAPALGFSGLSAGSGLSLGAHTLSVTQASAAASVTGTVLPAASTVTTGQNDTLTVAVNNTNYTLTLAPGTGDSPSALVSALNTAAKNAGAAVSASLTSSGAIQLSTTEQGSAASLAVTGGDAAATLGLTSGQSGVGADGVVSFDGTSTSFSAINPGDTLTLTGPNGSVSATVAAAPGASGALLATGSAKANLVSTGNGTLSSVVSAINNAGLSVTASAVHQASGSYLLQVGANNTGLAGAVTIDPTALSGGALSGMQTIAQAQDAVVTVGGTGGYQVSSSSDTFSGLLSGTAITVAATGQATITVTPDGTGEAKAVNSLVTAANQALSDIQTYAGYNATTKKGGPLMGSSVVNGIQQAVLGVFASVTGSSGLASSADVGITVDSKGSISFDQAKFESAYAANPSQVAALFTQGGAFTAASGVDPSSVSFVYAGTHTAAGAYAVSVSHSATQATDTGAVLASGTTGAAETLSITQGSASASYDVAAGATLSSIAAGLNAAFANAGMTLTASVINSGTQLQLASDGYGSAASFSVSSNTAPSGGTGLGGASAGVAASFSGTDVVGTINGVTAKGTGQVLAAPSSDPTLQGLSLLITTPGITTATPLGSFAYQPGIAQQLAATADSAANTQSGSLTAAIQGLQNEATGLNGEISNYQHLESQQQTLLQNQFATMETTLSQLKNESSTFSNAVNGLAGF